MGLFAAFALIARNCKQIKAVRLLQTERPGSLFLRGAYRRRGLHMHGKNTLKEWESPMKFAALKRPRRDEPLDPELERYRPTLEQELRDCLAEMRRNQLLFDLETEPELVEQRIYERSALLCRYRYLQRKARALGLRAIL